MDSFVVNASGTNNGYEIIIDGKKLDGLYKLTDIGSIYDRYREGEANEERRDRV